MNTFTKDFQVRSYEVDLTGRMRAQTLLNYLQDTAGDHASLLGLSVTSLFRLGLTWVLSRYHVRIVDYPPVGENIRVETWPSGRHGRFALRDFLVTDSKGQPVAMATSSWMVVSLKTGRTVRLEEAIPGYPVLERRAVEDEFLSLPRLEQAEKEVPFRVRMADLDINRHVNNVIYVAWALESVPEDIILHYRPSRLEVAFRSSATYGDRILSRVKATEGEGEPAFIHQLTQAEDGRELTRLCTQWRQFA